MLALYMEEATARMDAAKQAKAPTAPFGHLARFGREDTAHELTEASIAESNAMVDQIERAVVAETKRSMFRALTRLRGTTISSYDGMANSQAANVDSWAFPSNDPSSGTLAGPGQMSVAPAPAAA